MCARKSRCLGLFAVPLDAQAFTRLEAALEHGKLHVVFGGYTLKISPCYVVWIMKSVEIGSVQSSESISELILHAMLTWSLDLGWCWDGQWPLLHWR